MIWALWFTLANYRNARNKDGPASHTGGELIPLVFFWFSSYSYSHYTSVTLPHSLTNNNLYSYQVAHAARAYPGFHSMERLGVSLLPPPPWENSPPQRYPPAFHQAFLAIRWYLFILMDWERLCERIVFCLRSQHNDPAKSRPGVQRSNHHSLTYSCW